MNRITLAVALTVATLSTGALAQSNEEQQACMNDAFRVCSATIPDRNRTIACMVANKPQLSPACQMVMDKYAPGGNVSQMASAYAAPAPAPMAPARTTTRNASMKPVKTAVVQRPGKPLNILMR
jgi:predicted component of type VI protein secretion system